MSAPRLRGAEATAHTADIPSKNCSAVSSADGVATAAQARAAAQLFRIAGATRSFVPPATTRAGTAQRAVPTIALNTYDAGGTLAGTMQLKGSATGSVALFGVSPNRWFSSFHAPVGTLVSSWGVRCRPVGGTPTGAVETTALPIS